MGAEIIFQLLNPRQMEPTEISTAMTTTSIEIPVEVQTLAFCFCDFECNFVEVVFADLADTDSYKNDRSSFLINAPDITTGAFAIRLIKPDGTSIALTDNTYGTYFGLGTITGQATKAGYLAEWNKIATAFGFGTYSFEVDNVNFGNTITSTSRDFQLMPYSETSADQTVKIETIHNGCVEGGFDYTGMNWIRSIRIPAIFGNKVQRLETDNYFDTNNNKTQIRDQIVNEYTLETMRLPSSVMTPFIEDKILANQIFITDYNLFNFDDIRQLEVVATEINEQNYSSKSKKASFKIGFEQKLQNIIKRN
jgi:hypothetical protein